MQYLAGITTINITPNKTINIVISVVDAKGQLSTIDPSKNEHRDMSYQIGQ